MLLAMLAQATIATCAPNVVCLATPIISPAVDGTAAIALKAPPCRTEEAVAAKVCMRWEVKPCPPPPPSYFPTDGKRLHMDAPLIPIGCEDTWRGWR